MGGFFGTISTSECVNDLFYGTDYNSHLGTKKGGVAVKNSKEFKRSIQKLDDLVEAIGLPKERICTYCWDWSSYF